MSCLQIYLFRFLETKFSRSISVIATLENFYKILYASVNPMSTGRSYHLGFSKKVCAILKKSPFFRTKHTFDDFTQRGGICN